MTPRDRVHNLQDRLDDLVGGIEFRFSPMPWDWRWRWHKDELTPFWWIEVGPFAVLLTLNFLHRAR